MEAQLREWVSDNIEQETPESQRAAKVVTLERLLGGDMANAKTVLARLGSTTESIQKGLERQWLSVNEMLEARLPVDIARSLWAKVDNLVDKFMPKIAGELATAAQALNDAILAAGNSVHDFSEAKALAGKAQLLATKVKESLSAESARLTERPLDEHSRGSRLAKHWANLAKAQNMGTYPPPDAEQVLSSLKEQGLLAGTLSTGDPAGYLFATRLAGELENARNDELRLPMSPEQYAALEKGLVEYIVKWGQKRISRGVSRIVIELAFEQALDTVSFNVSNLFRLPYKILKASIKVPYHVNKVNNYTMPGQDKPYKAIYGLLGKKLKQLGFNLLTAPAPGVIKLVAGAGVTASAALHNLPVRSREKTFSAVYQHVAEGKQSEKIKMDSVGGMIFDSVFDTATTAAFKGGLRAWQSGESEKNVISDSASVSEHVGESNEQMPPQAQRSEMVAESDNPAEGNAASNEREAVPVSHSSPLEPQTDVKAFSDERSPDLDQPRSRRKRAASGNAPPTSHERHNYILTRPTLQPGHFDRDIHYQDLSDGHKKQTYLHGIQFVLLKIENDRRFSQQIRDNAYKARIGMSIVVPVDIGEHKLNNTLFLPDRPGAKSGVLINLDYEVPYYYIGQGDMLHAGIQWAMQRAMPYNADNSDVESFWHVPSTIIPSALDILDSMKKDYVKFEENFNYNNPIPTSIVSLSATLANTTEADYKLKGQTITNSLLISRAIAGAHIPDPGVSAVEVKKPLECTWNNLTPAGYLMAFARPFFILCGEMQLVSSSINGETIQETERHIHQAEYIGSWIDATVGAITSFTPTGWVLNTAQSAAAIVADLAEGKDPDPLAVASVILGCIPDSQIAAKIGKFSRIGGNTFKYGLMLGNKAVDLTIVGNSINRAIKTGEPLAIYQAFLACGMSVSDSYYMAKSLSLHVKIAKPMGESAQLKQLEAIHNNAHEYHMSSRMPKRPFKIGRVALLGRIRRGKIEISRDNGVNWKRGKKLHLLAYRLQNAGGTPPLPKIEEPVKKSGTNEKYSTDDHKLPEAEVAERIHVEEDDGAIAGPSRPIEDNTGNYTRENVEELLSEYEFPDESELYTKEIFTLSLMSSGGIPEWAKSFKKIEADNYESPFREGNIIDNGLREFNGKEGYFYRVDNNPPEIVLKYGFNASMDYTAIPKMLPEDTDGVIVSESLEGALRYQTSNKDSYIYRIKAENVKGVSLKNNLYNNERGLNEFLGVPLAKKHSTLESLAEDTNGAIYLDEVHLRKETITTDAISLVPIDDVNEDLSGGPWENYF